MFTLQYQKYDVFVGVYPNDQATMSVVKKLKEVLPNVYYAVCPNPGPTSKADNLNSMYAEIIKHEKDHNVHYEIFVIHDAEDVIHPLSLKLYNYLIPRKDMVQIPVFPLEVPLRMFTHWTYADEFAENHTKDIIAREVIGGFVPSAGVGTALSRKAVEAVAKSGDNDDVFSTRTLTEDYAFSLRLKESKLDAIFVHQSFVRVRERKQFYWFGKMIPSKTREWIATRALFPVNYRASVRQKSRWILGISLQEWKESGWLGNMATRYTLFRDRKGPVGHLICLAAYFFLGYFIAGWLSAHYGWGWNLPGITHSNELIWTLLVLNFVFLAERLLQRFIAVWRIYGFWPAVLSAPRVVYGNFINAHAFLIALSKFWKSVKTGEKPVWAKTSNVFPTVEQLTPYRRRLGDLLLASATITPEI
jgi:adsorption protein B